MMRIEETKSPVHSKRFVAATMIVVSVSLTGCGGVLRTDATAPNSAALPSPTLESSVEPKGEQTQPDTGVVIDPVATVAGEVVPPPVEAVPNEAAPVEQPPAPAAEPTINPALANVQLPSAADMEQRWRDMQVDRTPFEAARPYVSSGSEIVWWFDPLFGQLVPIGELRGEFSAQANFRIKGQWIGALEIPYHVNQAYGIIVPEPILQRMQNAGKGEWAEVFVYQTGDITQR